MANTKHDNAVRKTIRGLQRQGYNVKADLPGFEIPVPIGKNQRIIDIEATKQGTRKLIELEPTGKADNHKVQHATFRRHVAQKSRTQFMIKEF